MVYLPSLLITTALLLGCVSALKVSAPFDPEDIGDADVTPTIDVPSMTVKRRGLKTPGFGAPPSVGGKDELGLYVCTDANYQGACYNLKTVRNKCVNFAASINNQISSVTTDEGVMCSLYQDKDCKNTQYPTTSNGRPDLAAIGVDNMLSSYKCWRYK